MSIRLYQYLSTAPFTDGHRGFLGFSADQVVPPELRNVSLSSGFAVQLALKLFSLNDGSLTIPGAGTFPMGTKSQLFSLPSVMAYPPVPDSQYAEYFGIYVDSTGALHVRLDSTAGQLDYASAASAVPVGSWHRIVVNLTAAGYLSAFLDGAAILGVSVPIGTLNTMAVVTPVIGLSYEYADLASSSGCHLDAEVDSVWCWFTGLDPSDAASMANGQSPLRVTQFPSLGFSFAAVPTYTATLPDFASYNRVLLPSVFGGSYGVAPVSLTNFPVFSTGVFLEGTSSPGFAPVHRGRQRFAFPLVRSFGVGMDGARFADLAASHLVQVLRVSASDSAAFAGSASERASHVKALSDSATFTAVARGGVHAYKQLPSEVGVFGDLASSVLLRYHGGPASDSFHFHDAAAGVMIGDIAASVAGGARFFDQATAGGKWKVSATDTAAFHDNLAINGVVAFAADLAKFSDSSTGQGYVRSSDSATFTDAASGGQPSNLAASGSATFTDAASGRLPQVYVQRVSDSFVFLFTMASVHDTSVYVVASDAATFSGVAGSGGRFGYALAASDQAYVYQETVQATFRRAYTETPPGTKGRFSDAASATVLRVWVVSASDAATFTGVGSCYDATGRPTSASDSATFGDAAAENRMANSPASDSAAVSGTVTAPALHEGVGVGSATFGGIASATLQLLGASETIVVGDLASASVLLPGGSVVPGGDQALGLLTVLWPTLSTEYPACFAESAEGYLLAATGIDPMIAWDGVSPAAWQAGLEAPCSVVWMDGVGNGPLMGRRYAYIRWVDARGNTSNLSQVSDPIDLGRDAFIDSVSYSPSGVVTVQSSYHGLSTGNVVTIGGVCGLPAVNGRWAITVVDPDNFTLDGVAVIGGAYQSGGVWSMGAASIAYSNVATPTDPKVVRRQILRNLAGDASVFYVDVDTTDLTSTSFSSSLVDEQLAANCKVPIVFGSGDSPAASRLFQGGVPAANRFGAPPSHKCAIVAYAGRIFAAADRIYSTGNVQVAYGSPYVVGIGTHFTAAMAGRLLYVPGTPAQAIRSVIVANQILLLETPYQGPSQVFAFYAIRPAPVERLLVYYSEPHLPEAWPPWNAFSVPETSDEVVGLFVLKSFLYIVKERNIFKFAYKEDPGRDGYAFPVSRRGCVNNRCYVYVESTCYLLDEAGVYSFDGDSIEPISDPVQVLFKPDDSTPYRVDWTTDRTLWHASHDQARETIRWFVDLAGEASLTFAICLDYRRNYWWLEQFPEAVSASALAVVSGYRQSVVGTTGRRVYCLGQGALDGIQEGVTGTLRGTATGADPLGLTDATAGFPANLAGVPVTLVSGTGAGQQAIAISNTSTAITILDPWTIVPDATTVYQIGGVRWAWKSGWRQIADDESSNPRDLEFLFKPTRTASTVNARLYYDSSDEPMDWGYDRDSDGVCVADGSPNLVISLATPRGYAIQRMSGHRDPYGYGHRYLALGLEGVQGVEPQRVFQLVINGVE